MKSRNRIKDAKLSQKGQITIPKEVREKLGIDAGDRIVFYFDDNEEVKISSADNTEIILKDKNKEIMLKTNVKCKEEV